MDYDEIVERVYAADRHHMPKPEKVELLEALHEHLLECHTLLEQLAGDDERAKGYWLAGIRVALDDNHMYLGRSGATLADTIAEYREEEGVEDEEEYVPHAYR